MPDILLEAAAAADQGTRARQEDAMLAQFIRGEPGGMALLSDGMGGHGDGDLAARVIVSEAFARLSRAMIGSGAPEAALPGLLSQAVDAANDALRETVRAGRGATGMGGTLIAALISDCRLHWVSVGDSGLYLLRGGRLRRLNADHSVGAQIDALVARGVVSPEAAARHPHRACLTSALTGGTVAHVDCPAQGVALEPGDAILLVSDGVLAQGADPLEKALGLACAGGASVAAIRSAGQARHDGAVEGAGHPAGSAARNQAPFAASASQGGRTAAQVLADAALAVAATSGDAHRDNASVIVVTVAEPVPVPRPVTVAESFPAPCRAPNGVRASVPAFWRRLLARPRDAVGARPGKALP